MELFGIVERVRQKKPLVQCITNFVTVNDCANILLAAGASPTMAMDIREVEEAVINTQALVCNLGAIDSVDSMILAGKKANLYQIPVVLDPVAAGGTTLRRELSAKLLEHVSFTVIRGNASEIRALAQGDVTGCGVDVSEMDVIHRENLTSSIEMIKKYAQQTNSVIAVSGVVDIISNGIETMVLENGCSMMARITGSGCMLTTLIGAFCGAFPEDAFYATCAAMATMGICGELAYQRQLLNGTGNATFRTDLIDAVYYVTKEQFEERLRYEVY